MRKDSGSAAKQTEQNAATRKTMKQRMMTSDCFMMEPSRPAGLGAESTATPPIAIPQFPHLSINRLQAKLNTSPSGLVHAGRGPVRSTDCEEIEQPPSLTALSFDPHDAGERG